jgi:hypothetical protein
LEIVGHFLVVLDAGGGFDARTGVDTPGIGDGDGAGDVIGVETAGEDDAQVSGRRERPVEGASGAAVEIGGGAIEEQRLAGQVAIEIEGELLGYTDGLPNGEVRRVIGGRFVAVELGGVEGGDAGDFGDARGRCSGGCADRS